MPLSEASAVFPKHLTSTLFSSLLDVDDLPRDIQSGG
jgi:hypothetical protein